MFAAGRRAKIHGNISVFLGKHDCYVETEKKKHVAIYTSINETGT